MKKVSYLFFSFIRSGKGCVALDVCCVWGFTFVRREERVGGDGVGFLVEFIFGWEFNTERALLGD